MMPAVHSCRNGVALSNVSIDARQFCVYRRKCKGGHCVSMQGTSRHDKHTRALRRQEGVK